VTPIRPRFSNPPLIERALSVAFEPLTDLSIGDYGLFWAKILDQFPTSEAMDLVSVELEQFTGFRPARMGVQLVSAQELPRAAFRNVDSGELVQIQNNRFGFNWIKTNDDHQYPHSEAILERFFQLFGIFKDYIVGKELGAINITQCELTNVNVILVSDVGTSFADIATVLRLAPLEYRCENIRLEDQLVGSKHLMLDDTGSAIGRVHTLGQPALRVPNNEEAYRLDISARGAPLGSGIAGAHRFFNEAVSAVNAVFMASTTTAGRRFWGEIQ
jgi:uncharacterized protein (TIGR04255 family)